MPEAARGEGAASAGLGGGADAVTEPGKPEPGAETERQGCGSLQRMVRRCGRILNGFMAVLRSDYPCVVDLRDSLVLGCRGYDRMTMKDSNGHGGEMPLKDYAHMLLLRNGSNPARAVSDGMKAISQRHESLGCGPRPKQKCQ